MTSAYPTYIYKILPSDARPPSPLPQALPVSDLDKRDGFIHCSTSKQLLGTLNAFFSNESHVFILRIRYEKVAPSVKWENAAGKQPDDVGGSWDTEGKAGSTLTFFPHIYNGLQVGREEVDDMGEWRRGDDGWSGEGWCWGEVDRPV
ncbi:hypothetical protein DSL72_003849 [Monilinia vaccinii-corymbosi]|uniref:DUF952 domain-containing protein n=1 Tax=Monilinia vaccinii-corymbosi TaxID=61207 RepID=A0A8A3NUF8_9HELO|nr:hypothetical protein DSL72_003849 [Monilinia vaccinii-corymbosi]